VPRYSQAPARTTRRSGQRERKDRIDDLLYSEPRRQAMRRSPFVDSFPTSPVVRSTHGEAINTNL